MKLYAKKKAMSSKGIDYIPDREDCDENGALKWRIGERNGDSVKFPENNSTNATDPTPKNGETLDTLEKFFTEHEYRNSIILGGAGVGLVGILVALITCCVVRRRKATTDSHDL